jgi:hypothetical protein
MPGTAEHPDLLFAGQLLASELAGNAVRHAGPTTDERLVRARPRARAATVAWS